MSALSIDDGWLQGMRHLPSPNFDDRPSGTRVDLLVIHGICLPPGEFGGPWIDDLFTNCLDSSAHPYFAEIRGLEVSAHVLIRRDGEIVQYVSFDDRAWHAGKSCFEGRENCNDFSIGVELEGADEVPYESVQYDQLVAVTRAIMMTHSDINLERIVGHSDIAPGRKTDPGPAFDWDCYRRQLGMMRENDE